MKTDIHRKFKIKKKMYTKKRWKESKDKLMGVDESKEKEFKIVVIQKKDVIFA